MKTSIRLLFTCAVLAIVVITGCTNIPKSSPMAKIKYGMSRGEVIDILDTPTEIQQEKTWRKTLVPWKTVNDFRTVYFYNGLGSIEFDRDGSRVVRDITYSGITKGGFFK